MTIVPGQSFVTTALPDQESDFVNGLDSFFTHKDDFLELERHDNQKILQVNNKSERLNSEEALEETDTYLQDLIPTTLATAKQINEVHGRLIFCSLLNHGGSRVILQRRYLPSNCPTFTNERMSFKTTAGSINSAEFVYLTLLSLRNFLFTRKVKKIKAYMFDALDVEYDLILGRIFLNQVKVDVLSSHLKCTLFDNEIPFHTPNHFADNEAVRTVLVVQPFFRTHDKLFDGTQGCYPSHQFKIKLRPEAVPYHCDHPYPVPVSVRQVFKDKLDRQREIGVLEKIYESRWGMPVMVIPKKDGSICTVNDFLNSTSGYSDPNTPCPRSRMCTIVVRSTST